MKKVLLAFPLFVLTLIALLLNFSPFKESASGAPPYHVTDKQPFDNFELDYLKDWKRPEGPPKVGLQVGHWKNEEVPEELKNLRGNTGASGDGKLEWEVNFAIAQLTKDLLEEYGVLVEILPATIPPKFWADAFVAIHADGNPDTTKTGYKGATSWRDLTGKADRLLKEVEHSYGRITNLPYEPSTITRNMRGYYAFSWWRYEHTLHPMTPSVIFETGFLTTAADRKIIVDNPKISAQGLASGILSFLKSEKLL